VRKTLYPFKTLKLKLPLNPTNKSAGVVIVSCILFWALYHLMFFVLGPITPIFGSLWKNFTFGVSGTLTALLISWLFVRHEKRSLKEIGLTWQRGTALRFCIGLLIGGALFGLTLLALVAFTPLQLQLNTNSFPLTALPGYLAFIPLSLMEEIGFVVSFCEDAQTFGLRVTQLIIAILFALYHVLGGQSVLGSF
jgi:membrane protease YdiL (CAAX protease family)